MIRRTTVCTAIVIGCLYANMVSASPIYQFVFDQTTYTVDPGEKVDVKVYLQETVSGSDTSVLAPDGAGLMGAGVRLVFTNLSGTTDLARVISVSDIKHNSAFDQATPAVGGPEAKLSLFRIADGFAFGEAFSTVTYRLLLGTFTVTAGAVPGETTALMATDYNLGFADVVTGAFGVLDDLILDGYATIVTSSPDVGVPEPASAALMVVGGMCFAACLWRRYRHD